MRYVCNDQSTKFYSLILIFSTLCVIHNLVFQRKLSRRRLPITSILRGNMEAVSGRQKLPMRKGEGRGEEEGRNHMNIVEASEKIFYCIVHCYILQNLFVWKKKNCPKTDIYGSGLIAG